MFKIIFLGILGCVSLIVNWATRKHWGKEIRNMRRLMKTYEGIDHTVDNRSDVDVLKKKK